MRLDRRQSSRRRDERGRLRVLWASASQVGHCACGGTALPTLATSRPSPPVVAVAPRIGISLVRLRRGRGLAVIPGPPGRDESVQPCACQSGTGDGRGREAIAGAVADASPISNSGFRIRIRVGPTQDDGEVLWDVATGLGAAATAAQSPIGIAWVPKADAIVGLTRDGFGLEVRARRQRFVGRASRRRFGVAADSFSTMSISWPTVQ